MKEKKIKKGKIQEIENKKGRKTVEIIVEKLYQLHFVLDTSGEQCFRKKYRP